MNNTFSPARFGTYSKAEFLLNRTTIIRFLIVFIGIAVVISVWDLVFHRVLYDGALSRPSLPDTVGYVGMIICASVSFNVFQKPGGGTFAMQMPVSTLEKYTVRFVSTMIILPLLAIFIPRVVWDICHAIFASGVPMIHDTYAFTGEILVVSLFVQSTFFFGAILWRKQQLIKVVAAWVVFFLLITCIIYVCKKVYHITGADILPILDFLRTGDIYIPLALTPLFVALSWVKFRKLQILK